MKYLKPFSLRSLNENAGSLFTKTTHAEWTTKHGYNEEEFTDQELSQIKNHFKNWDIGGHPNGKFFLQGLYHKGQTNKGFRILKAADEWYYVADMHDEVDLANRYYKCDQLEGLINCLNHCISIQIEKEKEMEKEIQKIKKIYPRAGRDTLLSILKQNKFLDKQDYWPGRPLS